MLSGGSGTAAVVVFISPDQFSSALPGSGIAVVVWISMLLGGSIPSVVARSCCLFWSLPAVVADSVPSAAVSSFEEEAVAVSSAAAVIN